MPSSSGVAPSFSGIAASVPTTSEMPVSPFATVSVNDANANALDTVTIVLTGSAGTLTDGSGFTGLAHNPNGSYTLTGSASAVSSELQALIFTPAGGVPGSQSTTQFTLSDTSTFPSYSAAVTIANFAGANGQFPQDGLIADAAGDLFGTTEQGGAYGGTYGDGTVFELVKTTSGYNAPLTLASFSGSNGLYPVAGLTTDAAGELFGTTQQGGAYGFGTVFELTKTDSGYAAPVTLASFNSANGRIPQSGLIADAAGDLFGMTEEGGAYGGTYGYGTVFELVKTATGYNAPLTLVSFNGSNGQYPLGGLIADAAGDLFGTTEAGGANGDGTVFELVKTTSGYGAPVTLASFNGTNGWSPLAGLVADTTGDLFGTTSTGGTHGDGTVFELVKTASGYNAPVSLVNFAGTNGNYPDAGLTIDSSGDLFGTTEKGGASGTGLAFELFKTATGYSAPLTLASFGAGNGTYPNAGLFIDSTGNLFGTTATGGTSGYGTVFELTRQTSSLTSAAGSALTSVVDTDPAVAPRISGTVANRPTTSETPVAPFATTVITDANGGASDVLTISLSGNNGTLADGAGFSGLVHNNDGTCTLSGSAAAVTSELQALVFTPAAGTPNTTMTTTLGLSDKSSAYASAVVDTTTTVVDTDPAVVPQITGTVAGQTTTSETPVTPFATTVITDANAGASETLTITLSGNTGTLADGVGYSNLVSNADGSYTLSGSAAAVTAELQALVFTPTLGAPNTSSASTIGLSDQSSAYAYPISDSTTSVVNTDPAVAPQITGTIGSQATTSEAPVTPFATVQITDANVGASDTLTITLSGNTGTLADGSGFAGLTRNLNGSYSLGGNASAVTSELQALVFTPSRGEPATRQATQFSLSDTSTISNYSAPITLGIFNGDNGSAPVAPMTFDAAGDLFGTTANGGLYDDGTVFELVKTPSGYSAPVTLENFNGNNGSSPQGGFIVDAAGDLFGTTDQGGTNNDGTVFELVKSAAGYTNLVTLANFDGGNGSQPFGSLMTDASGDLFGTTAGGSDYGYGTVFELLKTTAGYSAPVTLASFNGSNGVSPFGGLIADAAGDLFGTTLGGGANNDGTLFELAKTANGFSAPITLVNFDDSNGSGPLGGLITDSAGDLFGVTQSGGANGYGTVFELVKTASGYSTLLTLASFSEINGRSPQSGLFSDAAGNLFGTTLAGGTNDDGTAFELVKTTTGYSGILTLTNFNHLTTGATPIASLIADGAGDVFGTTANGVQGSGGTVFELAKQQSSLPSASTNTTVTVVNADPAVAPQITGAEANQATTSETPVTPFATTVITDANAGASDTLTITLSGNPGTLADGTGFSGLVQNADGTYTLGGSAAAVTSELQALVFTPAARAPNTAATTILGLSDTSSAYGSATVDTSTTVIDTDPAVAPSLTGAMTGQTTNSEAPLAPFAQVTLTDANAGATDTLTITLNGTGTLTDGAGFTGLVRNANGTYTLQGSAAAVTSELDALIFTPIAATPIPQSTTTFTLSDTSSAFATPQTATASVIDSDPQFALVGANGADGTGGAAGGAGAAATLTNAVAGLSDGGTVALSQSATGGHGGSASGGGTAGAAGMATSTLSFNDNSNPTQSATLTATIAATGGTGGSSDTGKTAAGGAAVATSTLTGAHAVDSEAQATGGAGGSATATANGAIGGAATAIANGNSTTLGAEPVTAGALARGGDGGTAPGAGKVAGAGGAASGSTASATTAGTGNAIATVVQAGGSGGNGINGATAGAGADETTTNAVSGMTNGGSLSLSQTSNAGAGGSTDSGTAGTGGAGTSTLTFDDTTQAAQSAGLGGGAFATGGTGGGTATGSAKAGGAATASAIMTGADGVGAQVVAAGGLGGSGTTNAGGASGGAAKATAVAVSKAAIGETITASATAIGGSGGNATGTGKVAGAGGLASGSTARATTTGANSAYATVSQTGGSGGNGSKGATGGAGAAATLTSAATGQTGGGDLWLTQNATGGNGGSSDSGKAGAAGAATSTLAFNDTTQSTPSLHLVSQVTANGGAGGNSGTGTASVGGAASAASSLTGAQAVDSEASSHGGTGGSGTATASGAIGGAATGSAVGISTATQSSDLIRASIEARGGDGGMALGAGKVAGAGGVASGTTARATSAGTGDAGATVVQVGGSGGNANNGATAGAGATETTTNAASGITNGGRLTLVQISNAGAGGSTDSGTAGIGGAGTSTLTFDDTTQATQSVGVGGGAFATGGTGGGTATGTAKAGGAATASATMTGADGVGAQVVAAGGLGGSGTTKAGGAAGGAAKATAVAVSKASIGETITASATAIGGNGGNATGAGKVAGAGGVASGSTARVTTSGDNSAYATVSQTGGNGGNGASGAAGGAGAAVTLTNAATGQTGGGNLWLTQTATGGNGGSSDSGAAGVGGAAISSLTFNDTTQPTRSQVLTASLSAIGGSGGSNSVGVGGKGGAATATGSITGAFSVNLATEAQALNGGSGSTRGAGGAATATGSAIGTTDVHSTVNATGGFGSGSIGKATATAIGATGDAQAVGSAQVANAGTAGVLVDSVSGSVISNLAGNGTLADTTKDLAIAQFGVSTPPADTTDQGVAYVTGAPTAANIATVFKANARIASAFAVSPSYFAIAEMGGAYSKAGTGSETTTSTVDVSVDLSQLANKQDLLVGLYGGKAVGTGVTGVTLTISANGATLLSKSFASAAAAQTYFTNNAVDLGSLTQSLYANNQADISVSLSVTATGTGSGFYGNLLIGDPPPATEAASGMSYRPVHGSVFDSYAHMLGATTTTGPIDTVLQTAPDFAQTNLAAGAALQRGHDLAV